MFCEEGTDERIGLKVRPRPWMQSTLWQESLHEQEVNMWHASPHYVLCNKVQSS